MANKNTGTLQTGIFALFGLVVGLALGYLLTGGGAPKVDPAAPAQTAVVQPAPAPALDEAAVAARVAGAVLARVEGQLDSRFNELTARVARVEALAAAKPAAPVAAKKPAAKVVAAAKAKGPPPRKVPPTRVEAPVKPPPVKPAEAPDREGQSKLWKGFIGKYETKAGPSPAIGPSDALVKVFIVSDFQCPVCRRAAEGLETLYDENPGKVQWIFWHNPLEMHKNALPTAKASMAAFNQDKFWEYHDLLFQNSREVGPANQMDYANRLGLDLPRFKNDRESAGVLNKLRSDQNAAMLLGARGTPAFVINGKKQVGWGSAAGIASMVRRELEQMEQLTASGKSLEEAWAERAGKLAASPDEAAAYMKHFINGEIAEKSLVETEEK